MSEITGEIENIDKLFSEININGETHQSENYVEKETPVYQPAPEPQEGASFEPSPSVIGQDVTGIDLNSILHPIKDENISQQVETLNQAMQAIQQRMTELNALIPSQASASNKLADKAFVNSSVQTATANFRGNWNDFSSVPTDVSLYPVDYAGSKTPTVNDYLVVQDASDYTEDTLEGTWRFKYSGTWSVEGKNGWRPEYQVNETPLTQAQLEALNSGITAQAVENMAVIDDTTTSDTTVYSSEKTQNELDIRTSEYIATSSTSASTQIKVVTMTTYEGNTIPSNCELSVTFTYGNTASNPKLQVKNKNDVVIGTFDICDSRGHNADTGCWNDGDLMIFKTVGNKALITNSDVRSSTSSYIIYADGTIVHNKIGQIESITEIPSGSTKYITVPKKNKIYNVIGVLQNAERHVFYIGIVIWENNILTYRDISYDNLSNSGISSSRLFLSRSTGSSATSYVYLIPIGANPN